MKNKPAPFTRWIAILLIPSFLADPVTVMGSAAAVAAATARDEMSVRHLGPSLRRPHLQFPSESQALALPSGEARLGRTTVRNDQLAAAQILGALEIAGENLHENLGTRPGEAAAILQTAMADLLAPLQALANAVKTEILQAALLRDIADMMKAGPFQLKTIVDLYERVVHTLREIAVSGEGTAAVHELEAPAAPDSGLLSALWDPFELAGLISAYRGVRIIESDETARAEVAALAEHELKWAVGELAGARGQVVEPAALLALTRKSRTLHWISDTDLLRRGLRWMRQHDKFPLEETPRGWRYMGPEPGRTLLERFRQRAGGRRPIIDEEAARRLHIIRHELSEGDLLWLSEDLAAGRISEEAKPWVFYLFYQRGRPWVNMSEEVRDRITAALTAARDAGWLSPEHLVQFLFPIQTAWPADDSVDAWDAPGRRRWRLASDPEKMEWTRAAAADIRARGNGRQIVTLREVSDELNISPQEFNPFVKNLPVPSLALGITRVELEPDILRMASALAKDSPEDFNFVSHAARVMGRTSSQLQRWVIKNYKTPASPYLFKHFDLLPDREWQALLVGSHPTPSPSELERRVMTRLIGLKAGKKPWDQIVDTDLDGSFDYRGHNVTLSAIKEVMRNMNPPGGWSTVYFIRRRYGLTTDPDRLPAGGPSQMTNLEQMRLAISDGAVGDMPWEEIDQTHPELIAAVVRQIGYEAQRPDRGILWLTQKGDYSKGIAALSSPGRIFTAIGLYAWANHKRVADPDRNKPKTTVFYLAMMADVELRLADVDFALENGWVHKLRHADLPDAMIRAVEDRLASLSPGIDLAKARLQGFPHIDLGLFKRFLQIHYHPHPPRRYRRHNPSGEAA